MLAFWKIDFHSVLPIEFYKFRNSGKLSDGGLLCLLRGKKPSPPSPLPKGEGRRMIIKKPTPAPTNLWAGPAKGRGEEVRPWRTRINGGHSPPHDFGDRLESKPIFGDRLESKSYFGYVPGPARQAELTSYARESNQKTR